MTDIYDLRANARARGGAGYTPFETYSVEDALVDLYQGMAKGTEGPGAHEATGPRDDNGRMACTSCNGNVYVISSDYDSAELRHGNPPESRATNAWDDLPYVTGPVCYVCKTSIVTVEDRGGVCKQCRLDANISGIM